MQHTLFIIKARLLLLYLHLVSLYLIPKLKLLLIKRQPCEMNEGINNVACQPSSPRRRLVQCIMIISSDYIATSACAFTGEHNTEEVRLTRRFVYG